MPHQAVSRDWKHVQSEGIRAGSIGVRSRPMPVAPVHAFADDDRTLCGLDATLFRRFDMQFETTNPSMRCEECSALIAEE